MRELLVTITLMISSISAEEFEPKKRLGIPPEEDPNFWPARGRRSYWENPRPFAGNSIRSDLTAANPDSDYSGRLSSWASETDFLSNEEVVGYPNYWRLQHLCPRKKSISLVLPLDESVVQGCEGRCKFRGRRGGERHWRSQPLYAEEPGWIAIDYDRSVLRNSENEDPFIVARGKKRNSDVLNLRGIRDLDEVLNSYENSDPFFVARGKRSAKNQGESDIKIKKNESSRSVLLQAEETPNEFQSEPKSSKKASNSEEAEVSPSTVNRKFSKTRANEGSEDYKIPVFTKPMPFAHQKERHPRSQRSSTDAFLSNDGKWALSSSLRQMDAPEANVQQFQVAKARYSRPRDKHSNLQSILDEPFFISRGKKNNGEYFIGAAAEPIIKIGEGEVGERDKISGLDKFYDLHRLKKNHFEVADNEYEDEKSLRNRRGMLDELLKSDDPFYVTRGKKFYGKNVPTESEYFDIVINAADDAAAANSRRKFSIFSKSTRTKLLQKLYDSSRIIKPQDFYKYDSSNLTDNQINNDVN